MPKTIHGKPVDEEKWEEAKKQAAKEGHADNYAYIMSIYKNMAHLKSKPDMKLVVLRKGKGRPIGHVTPGGYVKTAKGWRKKEVGGEEEKKEKEKEGPTLGQRINRAVESLKNKEAALQRAKITHGGNIRGAVMARDAARRQLEYLRGMQKRKEERKKTEAK